MEIQETIATRVFGHGGGINPACFVSCRLNKAFLHLGEACTWHMKVYRRVSDLVQVTTGLADFVRGVTGLVIDHVRSPRRSFPSEPYAALVACIYGLLTPKVVMFPTPHSQLNVAFGCEDQPMGVSVASEMIRDARLCPDDEDRVVSTLSRLFRYLDRCNSYKSSAALPIKEILTRRLRPPGE